MEGGLRPMPSDWSRGLAIAAHPQDIEISAGAAIACWIKGGKSFEYLLISRGETSINGMSPEAAAVVREAQQRVATFRVGVTAVEFLDYADGLIEYDLKLRKDLVVAIRRRRPELVLTCNHHDWEANGRWNRPDQRHVGRALLDAVGDAGNEWLFREPGLEAWEGVRYVAIADSPCPTHAVDIAQVLDTAVAFLEEQESHLTGRRPSPPRIRECRKGSPTQMYEKLGRELVVAFELVTL